MCVSILHENQAPMEEAALEHQGQEELFHYCYHGDRKCVGISKSLVHGRNVPRFLLHVSNHKNWDDMLS